MAEVELDRVTSRYPDGTVALDDVSLRVADGEIMAIVGPSGSGKSTLLRVVAGLVDIERGRIVIGGNDVTHTGPQGRDVAMVFEGDALYPHLTAEGNLRFGLKIRHTPEDEIDERVKSGSKLLGLRQWLNRRPATLSAGEQQRVAVGRASVRRPSMYLLDEPLSHLDPGERFRLRREFGVYIRQMDVTTIIVTHDQEQAMAIGDRVAVMSRGRLDQVGTPTELYVAPADVTVASCLGDPPMSLLPGWFADGEDGSSLVIGRHRLTHPDLDAASGRSPGLRRRAGEPVIIGVRPEHVAPVGTGRRRGAEVELEVDTVEWRGGDQLLAFRLDDAGDPLVARAPSHVRARPGDRVRLLVDVSRLSLFDPVTGLAIWHGGLVA